MDLIDWCLVVIAVDVSVALLLCLAIKRGKRQLAKEIKDHDSE